MPVLFRGAFSAALIMPVLFRGLFSACPFPRVLKGLCLSFSASLLAPVMTPLMVYVYARRTVDLDYAEMFSSILATVVAPVVVGLVANAVLTRCRADRRVAERLLAVTSMIAICLICGVIAFRSRARVEHVGGLLLLGVTVHNLGGYLLGYAASRLVGINRQDSRTIAIEVGLQNGGLAANLAAEVLKLPGAAIVPALFSAVMNVTGSVLASIWAHRPPQDADAGTLAH